VRVAVVFWYSVQKIEEQSSESHAAVEVSWFAEDSKDKAVVPVVPVVDVSWFAEDSMHKAVVQYFVGLPATQAVVDVSWFAEDSVHKAVVVVLVPAVGVVERFVDVEIGRGVEGETQKKSAGHGLLLAAFSFALVFASLYCRTHCFQTSFF